MASGLLLERERERSALAEAVRAVAAGRGRTVSVIGSAGLGKTRLIDVGAALAGEAGFLLARAFGSELERDLGWGLAAELLEQLLEDTDPVERAAVLAGRAAPCELVLSGEVERDRTSLSGGGAAAITAALSLAVRRLAAGRPVAVLVDDVHWADPPSLRWLCHLASRAREGPVLLLAGFRPEEPDSPRLLLNQLEAAGTTLHPLPLSPAATADLVAPEASDHAASRAVHSLTGGNPFLIDQLMRHLGGPPHSEREVLQARPESLARIVELRLARLGDDAEALARAVAVLGVATSLGRAARVAELSPPAAATAAERLAGAGILADRLPLAFAHPLLLQIVRDGIRAARMEALRRCAASVLAADGADATQAAVHLLAAEPVGEPWAGELLARAGRRAFDRAAHDSAAAFLRRALAEPQPDDERPELLLDLGRALLMAGDDGGLRVLREAVAGVGDLDRRATVALEVGDAFVAADRLLEGISFYDQVLAEADAEAFRTPALARRALTFLGSRFEPEAVLSAVGAALEAIGEAPGGDRAALSLLAIVSIWTGAPAATCGPQLESALAARPFGSRSALEWSLDLAWLAAGLAWCDRYEHRDAFLDALIERARARGASIDVALGASWRSYGRTRQGELDAAWEDIRLARAVLDDLDDNTHMVVNAFALDPLIELGRIDDAERLLAPLSAPSGDDDITYFGLIEARARVHLARHRLPEARADFELLRDECRNRHFACPGALSWRPHLVRLLQVMGEERAARELAEEDLEATRRFGAARPLGQALVAAASTLPYEAAEQALEEAVAVLDTPFTRLDLARAEVARGALSRRHGHRTRARARLRRGYELAGGCGAAALAEHALAELRLAGARPRRERFDGPDSLTAAERQVAQLAAAGAGNREIAERLVVTRRTVETHLTSIYRKLGISGRDALADHLPEGEVCESEAPTT